MQKSNIIKILSILLILSMLLYAVFSPKVYASEIIRAGDEFLDSAGDNTIGFNETVLKSTSKEIYNILLTIGVIVAVIVGIVLGIQWMIASVEDKAKIKEMLVPYIVGCIVMLGAFTIWSTLVDFGQGT